MWIVRLALRRPYTFVVVSLLIFILGISAIVTTPKDIFPIIDIPVVSVIWSYNGLSPEEMANRMVTISERAMTTTVNDIEHIESQSYYGVAVIKIFFQPNAKVETALSQVTALVQTQLRIMPPGTTPPNIVKYDVSSVPVLQMGLSGEGLSEQQLFDFGLNYVRTQLATVQGASVPLPYGGKQAQIMVDIYPNQLYAKHLSPADVSNAISFQNLILPAGTVKMGDREYTVRLNSSPLTIAEMNELPIRAADGAVVLMKDVAQVRSGYLPQINVVRINGNALLADDDPAQRARFHPGHRQGESRRHCREFRPALPPALQITPLFDQSIFVRASIYGVLKEGVIAAVLTGIMILVFLGSWRSTLIVCTSIPLSILTSQIILTALGHSINVMTLGGMALAVGILVDDATVDHRKRTPQHGDEEAADARDARRRAADRRADVRVHAFHLHCLRAGGAADRSGQISVHATGHGRGVRHAGFVLPFANPGADHGALHARPRSSDLCRGGRRASAAPQATWAGSGACISGSTISSKGCANAIGNCWSGACTTGVLVLGLFAIFVVASSLLVFVIGQDFFPYVDSGQMRLHVRCPAGTRVEDHGADLRPGRRRDSPHYSARRGSAHPRQHRPSGQRHQPGVQRYGQHQRRDGDILISLNPEKHGATREYMRQIRDRLTEKFPQEVFFFAAANMTTQILNFGLPAPIDIQVVGRDREQNYEVTQRLLKQVRKVPGVVDAHIHQEVARPQFDVNVDRAKAQQLGLTQRDVAQSMLISLSGSYMAAPNQWLNPPPASTTRLRFRRRRPDSLRGRHAEHAGQRSAKHPDSAKDTHLLATWQASARSTSPT